MPERRKTPLLPFASCLKRQVNSEIVEVTVGAQVAILLVRAAFADKFTFLYVPFFSSVDGPATEVFSIEEPDLFLSGGCQRDAAGQSKKTCFKAN